MSNVVRVAGHITALSPIHHGGDEKTGSTPVLRSLTFWDESAGAHVRLPFLSGNAIRGYLRRLIMHDMIDRLEYEVKSKRLHHALFTGGVLESTEDTSAVADLEYRRKLRDLFPPIALLGTTVGNNMVQSCLKVDNAFPICREYVANLNLDDAADPRALHGVRTFTDVSFATRKDDLRAERNEDEQATQMLVEFEVFVPGTKFTHAFTLTHVSALEQSCLGHLITLWQEQPFIGGKSVSGCGRVKLEYVPAPKSDMYASYLREHAASLRVGLDELAAKLGG